MYYIFCIVFVCARTMTQTGGIENKAYYSVIYKRTARKLKIQQR